MRRSASVAVSALSIAVVAASIGLAGSAPDAGPSARARAAVEEESEQREITEQRLVALEAAEEAGTLGVTEAISSAAAPGWAGEEILNRRGDDWEPAIAADPSAPFVYVLHNRYGGPDACARNCPDPAMILHVSDDGGRSWAPERYLCRCRGWKAQYDPLLEVVPETGAVYAVWMNQFQIHFSRSLDRGASWSKATSIMGGVRWGDKPNFATSADGRDVYILFNGPSVGDVFAAVSHDAGRTWDQVRITDGPRYYFAYGTAVLPDGRVLSSQISFSYTGPRDSAEGHVGIHLFASDDGGASWTETTIDELELGTLCRSAACYGDFYDSGPALAADVDGDLVMVYSGASRSHGRRTVYEIASTDGGRTWTDPTELSSDGTNAAFAMAAATGDDDVRIAYAVEQEGLWNVRYRSSSDLGETWSRSVNLSDARSGTTYKTPRGFAEFYGDYGEIAITSDGDAVAVWGEGPSYLGPGGVWLNHQR